MPFGFRVLVVGSLALGAASFATSARANGRFPRAEQLLERGDPEKLVLSATYGLLVSDDRGDEWRHVCELGFAFAVAEIDPLLGIFSDGSLIVKGIRTLNRASPPFCAFEPVLGGTGSDSIVDFALDKATEDRVLALFMERGADGGVVNRLYESTDAARTFTPFGSPLPDTDVTFGITLDVAPGDPARFYVTATGREVSGLFLRSDGGDGWVTGVMPLASEEYPYIAALDPDNADVVYVRTDLWAPTEDGVYGANDGLFYSDDGGSSFRELFRVEGKLLGFALSPDGRDVLVGYGDPVDSARFVEQSVLGIYRASTSDFVFRKIYDGSVSCLSWTDSGLYVCTSQVERGFALGHAPNADFDLTVAEPFTPLLDLRRVRGPVECPACTSSAACLSSWPTTCALLGSCDAGSPPMEPGSANCAGAGGAGNGGGAGSGAGATGGAASRRDPVRPPDDSCGCRAVGRHASSEPLVCLVALAASVACRVLRRRGAPLLKG